MKVKTAFPIQQLSGKAEGSSDLVFSTRYGNVHAWRMKTKRVEFTSAQLELMDRFKAATLRACKDMEDPVLKAEWTMKMRNSYGKYKTARGCAFGYYYEKLTNGEVITLLEEDAKKVKAEKAKKQ